MKAKLSILIIAAVAMVSFTLGSCSDDNLGASIFDTVDHPLDKSLYTFPLDTFVKVNFQEPYNVRYMYKMQDMSLSSSDLQKNLTPCSYDKSVDLATLAKYLWFDIYKELANQHEIFLKKYSPRIIHIIGSKSLNVSQGTETLGVAEGGLKIMLYGVNALDIDNPRIVVDDWYADHNATPIDLNYGFFHTMHHEFCHILTQQKNYSTDFQTISAGSYHSSDWINIDDTKAAPMGFVSGYASSEYNEDFAETFATYVTMSDKAWNGILEKAGTSGAEIITKKLTMVKEYFRDSWNIDIDSLRQVVLRRSGEALQLNLRDLSKN